MVKRAPLRRSSIKLHIPHPRPWGPRCECSFAYPSNGRRDPREAPEYPPLVLVVPVHPVRKRLAWCVSLLVLYCIARPCVSCSASPDSAPAPILSRPARAHVYANACSYSIFCPCTMQGEDAEELMEAPPASIMLMEFLCFPRGYLPLYSPLGARLPTSTLTCSPQLPIRRVPLLGGAISTESGS